MEETSGKLSMRVIVKCLADNSITLDVRPSETIKNTKNKILGKHVPPEQHQFLKLFFGAEQLAENRTLAEYNIVNESEIAVRLVLPHSTHQTNTNSDQTKEAHAKVLGPALPLASSGISTPLTASAASSSAPTIAPSKQATSAKPGAPSCISQKPDWFLIFHNVAMKKNMGNILRSCAAFRVKAVICVGRKQNTSFFGSKGTRKHVDLIYIKTLDEARKFCMERQVHICGIEIMKEAERVSMHPFRGSTAFLLGNEGTGLSAPEKAICDHFVYISHPGNGTASLNVCVAGSIVFHQFALWAGYREHPRVGEKYEVEPAVYDPQSLGATFTRAQRAKKRAAVAAEASV